MKIKDWVPKGLIGYLRLIQLKRKYKHSDIYSSMISKSAKIGKQCGILRDVEIGRNVVIQDYTYVNKGSIIMSGVIGKFCSIGYHCQIGMHEHPTQFISTSPFTYGHNNILNNKVEWDEFSNPPIIGNDVWIGSNSVVLQGVKIGNGAIVAAGSVVTSDISPYTIVGGIPAREIKKRFSDQSISYLMEMKWWDLSLEELSTYKSLFAQGDEWEQKIAHK